LDISLGTWWALPARGGLGGGGGIICELALRNIPVVGLGTIVAGTLMASGCSKVFISSNDVDCLIGVEEKDTVLDWPCCCCIRALHRSVLLTSALTFLHVESTNVLACRAMSEHTKQTRGLAVLDCAACCALASRQRL